MIELDFERKFPIDRMQLDNEWTDQHEVFRHYSQLLADALDTVDRAKCSLERTKARLDGVIRAQYAGSGTKTTEAGVAAAILQHEEMIEAENEYLDAQKVMRELKADVASLDQRKSSLENLVKLHGQEYFSVPVVSDKERVDFKKANVNAAIRRKLNPPKGE